MKSDSFIGIIGISTLHRASLLNNVNKIVLIIYYLKQFFYRNNTVCLESTLTSYALDRGYVNCQLIV